MNLQIRSFSYGNRGFSLVELIITVAIIGILATIVIPNYGKLVFRSQSAEAKIMLGSLFSSEKAFYSEYGAYHSAFPALGFSPEGGVRFNVGFGAVSGLEATSANGYNTTLDAFQQSDISTSVHCKDFFGVGGAPGNTCQLRAGPLGSLVAPLSNAFVAQSGDFIIGAAIQVPTNYAAMFDSDMSPIVQAFPLLQVLTSFPAFAISPTISVGDSRIIAIGMNASKSIFENNCPELHLPPTFYTCFMPCQNGNQCVQTTVCSGATPSYVYDPGTNGSGPSIICADPSSM